MYKGSTELFRKKVEEMNQRGESFIFNLGDLDPICEKLSREKYGKLRFHSPELKRALSETIKKEAGIDFTPLILEGFFSEDETTEEWWENNIKFEFTDYNTFIGINKKYLCELAKSGVKEGKLSLNYDMAGKTGRWGAIYTNGKGRIDNRKHLEWFLYKEKISDLEYSKIIEEANKFSQKQNELEQTIISAIQQIHQTIYDGKIDTTLLTDYHFGDYRDSYIANRPRNCFCAGLPLTIEEEREYYKTHLNRCYLRPEQITEFKDSLITLIQRKITEFNNYKTSIIQQIIKSAQKQGLTKEQLDTNRSGWQNTLCSLKNRKEINNYQTIQLEQDIKNLVSAENQATEAEKEKTVKKEEERLKKEQAEREKKEKGTQTKKETEEKARQETEAKKRALENQKTNSITKITTALNQEPKLNNSDLSPRISKLRRQDKRTNRNRKSYRLWK